MQQARAAASASGSVHDPQALIQEYESRQGAKDARFNQALAQSQGVLGQQAGAQGVLGNIFGQQAGIAGQRAGLTGLQSQLVSGLLGQRAGIAGQQAGITGQQGNLLGLGGQMSSNLASGLGNLLGLGGNLMGQNAGIQQGLLGHSRQSYRARLGRNWDAGQSPWVRTELASGSGWHHWSASWTWSVDCRIDWTKGRVTGSGTRVADWRIKSVAWSRQRRSSAIHWVKQSCSIVSWQFVRRQSAGGNRAGAD